MMLSKFYKVNNVSYKDTGWCVSLELMTEHSLYKGHFPGYPIVPGVCIMQIIKECTADILGKELQYDYISSCKFLSAINPVLNNCLELTLRIKELEDGNIQLHAEGEYEGTAFVKLKATLF